jgi:uncharacterized protein with FMN-binding domain
MKRTKLLGVVCAAAMALVLAACVYDDAGQQPGPGPSADVLFPAITGTQTIRVEVPHIPTATRNDPAFVVMEALTGPESVDGLANSHTWSNLADSGEFAANLVLDVTFTPYRIADIRLISHAETVGQIIGTNGGVSYVQMIYPALTDQAIWHQSTLNIDAFTHATVTRNAFVRGINDAIIEAGGNPRTLVPQNQNATSPPAGARFIPGQVNIYVPAGTYVVMDPNATVLDIREITPALALELGMVNADGTANNAAIQRHGAVHNGFRRQPTPEIDARLGLAAPRSQTNPEGAYFAHYIHGATIPSGALNGQGGGLARALNQTFGYNLSPGDPNPLYGQPRGIWMQITFGFNTFYVNERGARAADDFTGIVMGGQGETARGSMGLPNAFGAADNDLSLDNNSIGGWWWSQVFHRQANDQQSTHNLDAQVNATMTANGVRVAIEQAMVRQGANVANVTPMPNVFRLARTQGASTGNPTGGASDLVLNPSLTTVEFAPGVTVNILLDRHVIRHLSVSGANAERIPGWDGANWTTFQEAVLFTFSNNADRHIATVEATPLMEGIDAAVATALRDAIVGALNANDLTGIDQSNRLGASSEGTGRDRIPPTPTW